MTGQITKKLKWLSSESIRCINRTMMSTTTIVVQTKKTLAFQIMSMKSRLVRGGLDVRPHVINLKIRGVFLGQAVKIAANLGGNNPTGMPSLAQLPN